jgi:Cu/Ag efflux protein CusF
MIRRVGLIGAIGFACALSGCALFGGDEAPKYTSGTLREDVVSTTAQVLAIDPSTRNMALRLADGSEVAFQASPDIARLNEVQAGDRVRVSYLESVVYHLRKPGEAAPGTSLQETAMKADASEAPAGAVARTLFVTATVRAIDRKASSVTLEAANGAQRTLKVRDPERLVGVKVGDLVEFALTQAIAVELEKMAN